MIQVSMLAYQDNEQHDSDPDGAKKGVGLQVAGLNQAQSAAKDFNGSMNATNAEACDHPFIDPIREAGKRLVGGRNQKLIKLIEIKLLSQKARECRKAFLDRIGAGLAVK